MSIAGDIITYMKADAVINAAADNNISRWPFKAASKKRRIAVRQVGANRTYNMQGATGRVTASFEVECWAEKTEDAETMAAAVIALFNGTHKFNAGAAYIQAAVIADEQDEYDIDANQFGRVVTIELTY